MNVITRSCLAATVFVASIGFAQQPATQSPALRPLSSTAPRAVGMPSEEEIKSFITTHKESETEAITLSASFTVPTQTPDALKRYARSGKVPYRVTFELLKTRTVDGTSRSVGRLTDGRATIAILDENGTLLKRAQESILNLCPS